jgi:signal transduction histidine kinase
VPGHLKVARTATTFRFAILCKVSLVNEPIRILYSDESPTDRDLVQSALLNGPGTFDLIEALSRDELRDRLQKENFDVILTDLNLRGFEKLQAFEFVQKNKPGIPVIIVTNQASETMALEAFEHGAADYVIKTPFRVHRLPHSVQAALRKQRSQDDLRRAYDELAKKNCRLERALARSNAEVARANQEFESFTYSVSHDLRAPLRAIEGFSRILVDDWAAQLSPDARHCVNVISSSARQMDQLMDAILALSRLSLLPLEKTEIDIFALATAVAEETRSRNSQHKVDLKILPLPPAVGEATSLRQAFGQLIGNAFKFTHGAANARVEIGSFREDEFNVYYVRDNGVGFDMRYVSKLFGMFQRLHPRGEYEGLGAGLALVQRIAQRHGGRVWAEGKTGAGACFYLSLPRSACEESDVARFQEAAARPVEG